LPFPKDSHPGIEIICRDRHGLYAEGARRGAPRARQVADRFHLTDSLREKLEKQMSRQHQPVRRSEKRPLCGEKLDHEEASEAAHSGALHEQFTQVRTLYSRGRTVADIVRMSGLSRKRVDKWVRLDRLPERNVMAPKPSSPSLYHAHLAQRWAEGVTKIRVRWARRGRASRNWLAVCTQRIEVNLSVPYPELTGQR
jgi:Transposase